MLSRLLACSRSFIEEPSLPDGMGDDVIDGILPRLELILAVNQDVFGDAKWSEGPTNTLQLGPAGALGSELLVFHNEQVNIGVGGLIPPSLRSEKVNPARLTSSTMACTIPSITCSDMLTTCISLRCRLWSNRHCNRSDTLSTNVHPRAIAYASMEPCPHRKMVRGTHPTGWGPCVIRRVRITHRSIYARQGRWRVGLPLRIFLAMIVSSRTWKSNMPAQMKSAPFS